MTLATLKILKTPFRTTSVVLPKTLMEKWHNIEFGVITFEDKSNQIHIEPLKSGVAKGQHLRKMSFDPSGNRKITLPKQVCEKHNQEVQADITDERVILFLGDNHVL